VSNSIILIAAVIVLALIVTRFSLHKLKQEKIMAASMSPVWRHVTTTQELKLLVKHGDQLRVRRKAHSRIAHTFDVQSLVVVPECSVDFIKNEVATSERVYLLESVEDLIIPVNSPRTIRLSSEGAYHLSSDPKNWIGELIEIEVRV
jgi:hypothetical protein